MAMKQAYVLPNIITAFGLACGLFVIFKINMVGPGFDTFDLLLSSSVLLLIAALADVLDGAIARAMRGESEFGLVFDSLADTVSFGVAPSVLLLKSLSLEQGSGLSFFVFIAAMLYSICGILRLVRYNVKASEIKGDELAMAAYKKNFTGLPIPAGAACALSLNLCLNSPLVVKYFSFSLFIKTLILGIGTLLIGFLMISKCKFLSLKALRLKVDSFYLVFLTVIVAIFVLYGIIHHFSLVFFSLSWGYLLLGCLLTLIRLIAGKKSKTLEEFDPDVDELE
jgi:CDP-diacylglycerol--serine O-phosphatidyltransferase